MNNAHDIISDETLFRRYCDGDMAAFDTLLKRMKGLVYSLILRFTHDHSLADEVFQEVFLKVCKYKDQFREAISFKAWLMTICRNTCIDYTRKVSRTLKTNSLDAVADESRPLSEKIAGDGPSPLDVVNLKFEDSELTELLDHLPEEQRDTFYMKIVSDMTFEEIGAAMKYSANTSKSRYRYAVETLRGLVRRKELVKNVGAGSPRPQLSGAETTPLRKRNI